MAEDGPIDARYKLEETPSSNYPQRTEWNARDSDGTVEMMNTMMHVIVGFAMLCGLVAVVGLIVWVKVVKGRRK